MLNETGDNHYLLNDLYISDYCCWLQRVKADRFEVLARYLGDTIDRNRITKSGVCLDILLIEKAAELAWNEEKELSKGVHESLRINVEHSNNQELDSDDDEPN